MIVNITFCRQIIGILFTNTHTSAVPYEKIAQHRVRHDKFTHRQKQKKENLFNTHDTMDDNACE